MVLGGIGNIRGSIIAACVLTALPEVLRGLRDYRMLIYAGSAYCYDDNDLKPQGNRFLGDSFDKKSSSKRETVRPKKEAR